MRLGIQMDRMDVGKIISVDQLLDKANKALLGSPQGIGNVIANNSPGTANDYTSNGDYWWPNPETEDGLPYVVRDGETNPNNFNEHRHILRSMRHAVTYLAAAWKLTQEKVYADTAIAWLDKFFIDEHSRMKPHLCYAQAIPGICEGRGIGIIDSLHLIEVPQAIEVLKPVMKATMRTQLLQWFEAYLLWLNTHPNSMEERDWPNNHAVAWLAQVSAFARFTQNDKVLRDCRRRYKEILLPNQMADDGSFPREIKRTKPYNYSNFILDNMVNICYFASEPEDDLWVYEDQFGHSLELGLSFLVPYVLNKASWPYAKDIEHDDYWPVAMSYLLFSGLKFCRDSYIDLWCKLEQHPDQEEILRNMAIQCPYLFVISDL